MKRKIRFGIFGLGRGAHLSACIGNAGAEVVAVCDYHPTTLKNCIANYEACKNAVAFDNFDEFIKCDMDAVLLCNYFCEHAPYAVKAMRAGKHVLSETIGNITLAQGVELCRVKEETGMTYALLENYPYFKENLEMRRVFHEGTLGSLVYAEGEYIHPMSVQEHCDLAPDERHWRNWTPRTYYSTHALAPLMMMTDSIPTRVSAMASFQPEVAKGTALRTGDAAAVILCQTNTHAIFRVIGWGEYAPHGNYYRLCCLKGGMETNHSNGQMRLCYNQFSRPDGIEDCIKEYPIEWQNQSLGEIAQNAGHGGGDFMSVYEFVKCLENGTEPYFNVYRSTTLASVAILAWRSILNSNTAYDVPDFRNEEDRRRYEFDTISPYPDEKFQVDIPCSSLPYHPTEADLENAHRLWEEHDCL